MCKEFGTVRQCIPQIRNVDNGREEKETGLSLLGLMDRFAMRSKLVTMPLKRQIQDKEGYSWPHDLKHRKGGLGIE
jgi:hypothetical protein